MKRSGLMTLVMMLAMTASSNSLWSGAGALQAAGQGGSTNAPVVVMKTSMGEIRMRLAPDKAPISVENFLAYVDKQFYDGTIFHRVIPSFMIQGGGYSADMQKKGTRPAIK